VAEKLKLVLGPTETSRVTARLMRLVVGLPAMLATVIFDVIEGKEKWICFSATRTLPAKSFEHVEFDSCVLINCLTTLANILSCVSE